MINDFKNKSLVQLSQNGPLHTLGGLQVHISKTIFRASAWDFQQ